MCDFCGSNRNVPEIEDSEYVVMTLDGDNMKLDYDAYSCDSSFNESIKINFCPYCGQKTKARGEE